MAIPLDPKQIVSGEKLLVSQVISPRLLVEKEYSPTRIP